MAGGKIKGISKKEGGDIKKFERGQRAHKRALPPMGGSSVAAPFHFEALCLSRHSKARGNEPAAMYA